MSPRGVQAGNKECWIMKKVFILSGLIGVLVLSLTVPVTAVLAQNEGQGEGDRTRAQAGDLDRDRDQDRTKQFTKDQIRERLHKNVDATEGLSAQEREQMHKNVDACVDLGISEAGLETLFSGEQTRSRISARTMLRLQERIKTAAQEGLPVDPVVSKIQEGQTKGVPEPLLEQACERMENHVRAANRILNRAAQEGFEPPNEPARKREAQKEMAQQMWRGMNEEGYEQLRTRARERVRDGECDVEDLVAAGELATRLMEAGVERKRAMNVSGDALQQGYRTAEMRQFQVMVAARHQRGESMDDFTGGMEHCVGAGMGVGEMYNYMMRHGWMGPGDMYGPGGYKPTDPKGFGGGDDGKGTGGGHGDHGGGGGGGSGTGG
jgi:hypothetical protein